MNSGMISAADYGAIDDGLRDNSHEIQQAIFAAENKRLHFPYIKTGVYLISGKQNGGGYFKVAGNIEIAADPGVVIKVADGVADYDVIFASSDGNGKTVVVRDLTIDQNSENNSRDPSRPNNNRNAFQMNAEASNPGLVAIFDNVTILGHNGVYAISAAHYNHVSITNCCVLDTNENTTEQADTSALYLFGNHITVTGNVISAANVPNYYPISAIETHGGMQTISDNKTARYRSGVVATAIAPDVTKKTTISIAGNICSEAGSAISAWNGPYNGDGATPAAIEAVNIVGNTITLSKAIHSGSDLTGVNISDISTDWPLHHLNIHSNVISVIETGLENSTQHESLIRIRPLVAARMQSVSIIGNTLVNAPSFAIEIFFPDGGCDIYKVENNIIIDPMQSAVVPATARCAVYLNGGSNLKSGSFSNNVIRDSNQIYSGVYVQQDTGTIQLFDNDLIYDTVPSTGYRLYAPASITSAANVLVRHVCDLSLLPISGTGNNPSVYGRPGSQFIDDGSGGAYIQNTIAFDYTGAMFVCKGSDSSTGDWVLIHGDCFRRTIPYNPGTTSPYLYPRYIGEIVFDSNAGKFMIATGMGQTAWHEL